MIKIFFVTNNDDKVAEWQKLAEELAPSVEFVKLEPTFREIQTDDNDKLVRDKCIKAFQQIGRNVVVEHTSLNLPYIGGFPGGLTDLFWRKLQSKKICELFGTDATRSEVIATTTIGYCDSAKIHIFNGSLKGNISDRPCGDTSFQWDDIFVPKGRSQTFAEMGIVEKNKISMRRLAFRKLIAAFPRGNL
jgi:XTP/dITP diphosphohydrolase